MLLSDLVGVSRAVGATRSRLEKRALLAACLRRAAPGEIALVVSYLGGTLPQGRIGLGPSILRDLQGEAASVPSLEVCEADAAFRRIAAIGGKGSQQARRDELGRLFQRATAAEQDFLVRLVLGELRQGALEGLLVEAIAEAAEIPADEVRRAVMLASDPAPVAAAVLSEGRAGLGAFRLQPLSPVRPMLAQPADDVDGAMGSLGEAVLDYKLDGARVQIHRVGGDVRIFSRGLNDVTDRLPEVVEATRALPESRLILDGEVIALRDDGRPLPFQVTMRRFGRRSDVDAQRATLPLSPFLFDVLHAGGEDLLDAPLRTRAGVLRELVPPALHVERRVTADPQEAAAFLARAFGQGHEGIMAKDPASRYAAGNRGAEWLKVKQAHTLDLVVLAAEWGSGRRKGWLSNLHLGARDPANGGFVMLGKTFKGLTDRMLEEQTRRFLELELGRAGHVVHLRPEFVVEIAVSDIQDSPQYPAGLALRFARVRRFRPDKPAGEADTIDTVRAIHAAQSRP